MNIRFIYIFILFVSACGTKQSTPSRSGADGTSNSSDRKALELADRMMNAMGGANAWNETRYFRFDFVVEADGKDVSRHQHLWDKFTGRYRVQGKMRDGKSYCMLYQDINKKLGRAYIDGKLLEGKEAEDKLQYGYNRFINDTYWIIMPWKLKDPGVTLSYDGLQKDSASGIYYETLHLTFDQVGLTPKDQYWAFINPETYLMDKWRFLLQDSEDGSYYWKNWEPYGSMKFSTSKQNMRENRTIKTEEIKILNHVNEDVFSNNQTLLP
ncbi:hypothetical protein JNM05_11490 [bacterium]|nr:hypothetical protein [bacterium]